MDMKARTVPDTPKRKRGRPRGSASSQPVAGRVIVAIPIRNMMVQIPFPSISAAARYVQSGGVGFEGITKTTFNTIRSNIERAIFGNTAVAPSYHAFGCVWCAPGDQERAIAQYLLSQTRLTDLNMGRTAAMQIIRNLEIMLQVKLSPW